MYELTEQIQICLVLNPLYTGGLFHCYMLYELICHFRVSALVCYSIFYDPVSK